MDVLSAEAVAANLPEGWRQDGGEIVRSFAFNTYARAALFTAAAALLAEEADHHPDLRLTYGAVEARLSTHDPKGITEKDIVLARRITALFAGDD